MALDEEKPILAAALPGVGEDSSQDDDPAEFAVLQQALKQLIHKKQQGAAQKQAQVLQGVEKKVSDAAKAMEAQVLKETSEALKTAKTALSKLESHMEAKHQQMVDLAAKFNTDLQRAWEEYNDLYSSSEAIKQEAKATIDKRRAALKRKINQLSQDAASQLAEAEKKLAKISKSGNKLPGLAQMLQKLL